LKGFIRVVYLDIEYERFLRSDIHPSAGHVFAVSPAGIRKAQSVVRQLTDQSTETSLKRTSLSKLQRTGGFYWQFR
jgi:hypothetical protein